MNTIKYKGYTLVLASSTGGKAGKGRNKTTTLQIRREMRDGYLVIKSIRHSTETALALALATAKACDFVDAQVKRDKALRGTRREVSRMNPKQRAELFRKGMEIINNGKSNAK